MPISREPLATLELYAAGLGLMLYSPAIAARLVDGHDYLPAGGGLAPPLDTMVHEHEVVMLGTGSPQLDYRVRVFLGVPPADQALAAVDFGLRIGGGALCVRDGYDAMEWSARGESLRRVEVADGDYLVHARWLPGQAGMAIDLHLEATHAPLTSDGWPLLEYVVAGDDGLS